MPACSVIPVLGYPDVGAAVDWLRDAFGFKLRLRIANHRAQMDVGDGATVVAQRRGAAGEDCHSVMVRVDNVDSHQARALQHGARVLDAPADYPFGERQYTVEDLAGHRWTFSQSIADVDPKDWGGTTS
ncbi:VOC family protein [Candidatus Binatus sp.]|uniref:VOC family protein n=1 Tax=Candidatus Binatus sp. TaxID=2811406 RepID=UPI003C7349D3